MSSMVRYALLAAFLACRPTRAVDPPEAGSGGGAAGGQAAPGGAGGASGGQGGAGIDSCASARPLTTAPLTANTTTGTSTYTTECGGEGYDLLFRFTLTAAQDVMLVASPIDRGRPILALLEKPCAPGALTTLTCGDGSVTAYNLPAGEYYALLDSPVGGGGPTELNLVVTAPTLPPSNDGCAQALALMFVNDRATATGDTRPATNGNAQDAGMPSCSKVARQSGHDVVYQYTLTRARNVTFTLTPHSAWRPALYVTAGCAGPELACSARAASGPVRLTFPEQRAGTYFVWVDGTSSGAGHATGGAFTLAVEQ